MTKQALPAVSILTADTLEDFKTADKVVIVGYFGADDKTSNSTFSTAAEGLRDDFLFGATSDPALAKAAGVKQPAIVLYKDFDDKETKFEEKFDSEAITSFAKTASTPLVGEVGPETYAGYMAVRRRILTLVKETCTDNRIGQYPTRLHLRRDTRRTHRAR